MKMKTKSIQIRKKKIKMKTRSIEIRKNNKNENEIYRNKKK